jgi:hypothetical protein
MGHAKQRPAPPPPQPAELINRWRDLVRSIDECAELDFSFAKNAIEICDMRVPNALRYGVLFTRREIDEGAWRRPDEIERRVREFMR